MDGLSSKGKKEIFILNATPAPKMFRCFVRGKKKKKSLKHPLFKVQHLNHKMFKLRKYSF